jgi:26S proteasome regulatory subunit N10
MSLEATMILIDNSYYAINGDKHLTRWDAQKDAASLLSTAKFNAHPESIVGVGLLAGPQTLLTAPTEEQSKIMASLHNVELRGTVELSTRMSIAQLALKHRLNKAQRQRIIVFLASPIQENEKAFIQLAKKLKKNEVAVDFVNVAVQENVGKLQAFIETVSKEDNSHLLDVPKGLSSVSDLLVGSAILGGQ